MTSSDAGGKAGQGTSPPAARINPHKKPKKMWESLSVGADPAKNGGMEKRERLDHIAYHVHEASKQSDGMGVDGGRAEVGVEMGGCKGREKGRVGGEQLDTQDAQNAENEKPAADADKNMSEIETEKGKTEEENAAATGGGGEAPAPQPPPAKKKYKRRQKLDLADLEGMERHRRLVKCVLSCLVMTPALQPPVKRGR